jgi:hypothetical protein
MRLSTLVLLVACSSSEIPSARFANAPPVRTIDDRHDVPAKPEARRYSKWLFNFDGQVYRPLRRVLALESAARARGVSAIDEAPDSTWFTNRIGVRTVTPDEIRAAPGGVGSPEPHTPWTIRSTKIGGTSVGFIITDARGERFLVKFDSRGHPEAETGAHVIAGKLLWACGYNVTEDYIAFVRREDLILATDSVSEDVLGNKRPLDLATVERKLSLVERERDGRYRTMVSRMLPGKSLGGHPPIGTRDDDPNDVIPHEERRDLRGARAIFSWLDHVDVQDGQFLDAWVEDPQTRHHYVEHYLLDYGLSLGVMALVSNNLRRGYEYYLDPKTMGRSLVTLGAQDRGWAGRRAPGYRGLGVFEIDAFDPGAWKPTSPSYVPFVTADRYDNFWGAKLVMRFTPAQLRAAVEAARFTDRRTVEYLVRALIARQRITGRYWFSKVNPLDRFVTTSEGVCYADLMVFHQLARAGATSYRLRRFDRAGNELGRAVRAPANATGQVCVRVPLSAEPDGYTILRIDTHRDRSNGTTYVHLARSPRDGFARVVGIWRP